MKNKEVYVNNLKNLINSKEYETLFEDIKHKLSEDALLAFPNMNIPFILTIDASTLGNGAIVSQKQPESKRLSRITVKSTTKPNLIIVPRSRITCLDTSR